MEPIILASGSPRRQEFFRLLGLPFSIMPPAIDETYDPEGSPQEVARDLAKRKVARIAELHKDSTPPWIAGADTIISLDGKIMGKPKDRDDARAMLGLLRGHDHKVVTAAALYKGRTGETDCRAVTSTVTFAPISDDEIEWYLDSGEWQGAAGAYKLQGLAACFASCIKGSFSAIVGLPLREFYVMLRDNGYPYR